MYICHVVMGNEGQKRLVDPLVLVVVSGSISVLRNKLGSFRSVMNALNHWAISQVCCFLFVWDFCYCCLL